MVSQLDPKARLFLTNLNRIEERMNKAQRQVTTGIRVNTVSDEPDHIATLLSARQHLEAIQQMESNLGRVKAETDAAEDNLRSATDMFERVRTLGTQGANPTQTADTRRAIAGEIGGILEQLVGLADTSVEGRFIFSGDSDHSPAYSIDLTQATPISSYLGTSATRQTQHPNGTTFAISHTAQQIFASTDPTTSVFGTINALRTALLANDTDAIRSAGENLIPASTHLQSELAFYGTTQNKVAAALEFGEQRQLQLKAQISFFEDADLTEAVLNLQLAQTQQQAALQSWAQIPRSTLFDYLG